MTKDERLKRINQLNAGLKWFNQASTLNLIKIKFGEYIDDVSEKFKEDYKRWEKLNDDISEIYMTGTEEEKKMIDEIFTKHDIKQ